MAQIVSVKKIATLGKRELRYTSLGGELKYDIRVWKDDDKYEDGVRFTEEELRKICDGDYNLSAAKRIVCECNEYKMYIDCNGRTYTRTIVTEDEMKKLVEIVKSTSNILAYEEPKPEKETAKRGRPKKNDTKKETKKKEDNIIKFPKEKVEIEKLVTEGNATYEQCEEKINKEKELYKDPDSQYVLDGVLELCKVDSDFRNNVMREDKTYKGAFEYMAKMSKDGYAYKIGQAYSMDRDMGLGFTIDYYNSKPEEKKTEKKGK